MSIMDLVISFVKIAKELQPKYIEAWLSQKENGEFERITDYDMDMTLLDEKKARQSTYKKLANEIQSRHGVEQ